MVGIDVSNAQGNIDWEAVKAADVEFVIIRCGWGGDFAKQDDPKFNEYASQCEQLNIPYGVYLYSYALNTDSAKSEANHTLRMLGDHKPQLGVWFDMEDADHYKQKHGINVYQSRQLLTDICKTYCDIIKAHGYNCGIYAAYDYWKNVLYKEQLTQYPIWLAIWGPSKPPMPCTIWQYTDVGHVPGIRGNVDMDVLYEDAATAVHLEALSVGTRPVLKLGSTGRFVEELQTLLKNHGYQCSNSGGNGDGVTGTFDKDTYKALVRYQSYNKECGNNYGTCDAKTWKALLGR